MILTEIHLAWIKQGSQSVSWNKILQATPMLLKESSGGQTSLGNYSKQSVSLQQTISKSSIY